MLEALHPTQDPGWVSSYEGYNGRDAGAVESRLVFGNGFLGTRSARLRGEWRGPGTRMRRGPLHGAGHDP
jgi:hypothetical protein